jgi:hypothetical protein
MPKVKGERGGFCMESSGDKLVGELDLADRGLKASARSAL